MQNMKDFDQLLTVWKQQEEGTVPTAETIIFKAKKEQQQFAKKIILQVITLLATLVALIIIGISIPFTSLTTYIGLGIMYACILTYTLIRWYQMKQLKKIDLTQKPTLTLIALEKALQFQQWVATTVTKSYFISLNVAFVCYFIEVLHPMTNLVKTIVISIYIAWMLLAYFYLGAKQKKKEYDQLQKIITAIQDMEANYEQ